jgi:hypothetical protein
MKIIIEIIIAVVITATVFFVAILIAKEYIKIRAAKQRGILGIDWKYIWSADNLPEAAGRIRAEWHLAHQRFAHGYDSSMFQNFHNYLDYLIMADLRHMIEHRGGSPHIADDMDDDETFHSKTSRTLHSDDDNAEDKEFHENFTVILKEMLFHFEQSKDEYCLEKNEYEDAVNINFVSTKNKKETGSNGPVILHSFDDMFADKSEKAQAMRKRYFDRQHEIERYQAEHHSKALKMLRKYYDYLWD